MRRKFPLSVLFLWLSVVLVVAQDACPAIIQQALQTAEAECNAAGRNQICYGHTSLVAESQPDAAQFDFEDVGDIEDVAEVQSLRLAGLDADNGTWGLVLMRVQANIPDTLPGQNVTIMLFGDSEIRNSASSVAQQVPPEQQQTINAAQNVNVRDLPSTAGRVLGNIAPGTSVTATGRTSDNSWVRIIFEEQTGWISASLVAVAGDLSDLIEVDAETAQFGPMQAFYFSSGIGQTQCNEVPGDGMLIQTPEGVASIDLTINEVQVSMGSTVYFTINGSKEMAVYSLEGGVRVSSEGKSQTSVEGSRVRIPLDDDFIADGEPFEIESYIDNEFLDYLPIDLLEREIEIEVPLDDEDLALFLQYDNVFEHIDIDDVDEMFDYIDANWDAEDFDIVNYLIDDLDYTDFDDELEAYFRDELDFDLDSYEGYFDDLDDFGEDFMDDFDEDFDDEDSGDEDFADEDSGEEDFDDEGGD